MSGFLFLCKQKGGDIIIIPLVTEHYCLLKLKMGHVFIILVPDKSMNILSKERILELNPVCLHAYCSYPVDLLFNFSSDSARCNQVSNT